jgi:cysteine-rich repeat protein
VQSVQIRDANGDPAANACGSALAVLRGKPVQGCTLEPRYPVNGDPGPDCGVFNYGVDQRSDNNCDGTPDFPADKCPFLSEWNSGADSDGDCAGGVGGACRGDECECGDANLSGGVNVTDLVQTNLMIFGSIPKQRIADANSDLQQNVSDIVAQNQEIFSPDSSTCRHITSIRCGNNVVDSGEACDNGAKCVGGSTPGALCDASGLNTCGTGTCQRLGGDGCNPACRIERGFQCTGSPSVCTPL